MNTDFGRLLDEIGLKYKTDKASSHHNYLHMYGHFLSHLREHEMCLLEIGVYHGGSIRAWREFFPNGKIVGLDMDRNVIRDYGHDVYIEVADQSNIDDLLHVGQKHGPFDIIIDDGSHKWSHQITSLHYLFPFVKKGGYYIIEDLHTSYEPLIDKYGTEGGQSTADYLLSLANYVVAASVTDSSKIHDNFARFFRKQIEYVLFSRQTSIIRRRAQ